MPQLMPLVWMMSIFMSLYIALTLIDMFFNKINVELAFNQMESKNYNNFMW